MVSTTNIVTSILSFSDEKFFQEGDLLQKQELDLLDIDFLGIAINAPKIINTNIRAYLPIILAARFTGERDWNFNLGDKCILIGINVNTCNIAFEHMFKRRENTLQEQNIIKPEKNDLSGIAAQIVKVDAKSKLDIPWGTGEWVFTAINYDWVSNSIAVTLQGNTKPTFKKPKKAYPKPNLEKASSLPSYFSTPNTNELQSEGLKFKVKPIIVDNLVSINISGAFTISQKSNYIPEKKIHHQYQDKGKKEILAIVPLSCLIISANDGGMMTFDWMIPVYEIMDVDELIKGYFSINVFEDYQQQEMAGNYACYIILTDSILGPHLIEIPKPLMD